MELFNVYSLYPIEIVKALGTKVWDKNGVEYTDLYGGHAVISIGHCHPYYVQELQDQISKIGFYSNAVENSLQKEYAQLLGKICGYDDYKLFLCNSGAEANENAIKLASFTTGRSKILAFNKAFHGRTSGAVSATDNPKIRSLFNQTDKVSFVELNDIQAVEKELSSKEYAAVIIEGIQGVAGIYVPDSDFFKNLRTICDKTNTLLICDEIQSGYGRSGKFFAHQYADIKADIITIAKGMANGFPMGGVLISPKIKEEKSMLGTTFGGNHLACRAAIAVLKVIENERLIENSAKIGTYLKEKLQNNKAIKEYRGLGLMIGLELKDEYVGLRDRLLFEKHIFTGAAGPKIIRLLPSLSINEQTAEEFVDNFNQLTNN